MATAIKTPGKFIGDFYTNDRPMLKSCKYVGSVYKTTFGKYVIWNQGTGLLSAEFPGSDFKKIRTMNYGCGQIVNEFAAK